MKKIKLFLGGYVNYLNAQNINCRALSEHLDKNQFELMTILSHIGNANDFKRTEGVRYIRGRWPMRFFQYYVWFRGVALADVAYLPKGECDRWCRFVAKVFHTKVFTTIEGIMDDVLLSRMKDPQKYLDHFRAYGNNLYSITKYIASREKIVNSIECQDTILYLGVETKNFCKPHKEITGLNDVVFIGNDPIRKNARGFIEAAEKFPDINFHIAGGNKLEDCTIEEYIASKSLNNVIYHGSLDHTRLAKLLSSMDLMFFPSRSEGFPKVMLETACAGVPTLCYDDYGAQEWITSGVDGYVVRTKEEAFAIIQELKDNPEKLKELSRNAVELGKRFDWSVLVKKWEKVIIKIYNEK